MGLLGCTTVVGCTGDTSIGDVVARLELKYNPIVE